MPAADTPNNLPSAAADAAEMGLKPPFGAIARALKKGAVVPFLGAGVNFGTRTSPTAKFDEKTSEFLPSGAELSQLLADLSSFPSDDEHDRTDLGKVASYYQDR